MKQFTLSHVVLYAKGWYTKTEDIWADLTKILEYDDYTPFTNGDVLGIIVNQFEKADLNPNIKSLSQVLIGIQPSECWKYGYNCTKETYDVSIATIYYILSILRFIDNSYWIPKVPKYSKDNPRPKDIELKQVLEHFNKNNKLCHH